MLRPEPVRQELYWRRLAERGVQPFAVVERFDVVKEVGLRVGVRSVRGPRSVQQGSRRLVDQAEDDGGHRH